ncbi:MAG TPA: hypothetical protein VJH55_02520 [Candidatus Paceibacterota bacterium]
MELDKSSWIFKVAYGLDEKYDRPQQVSLCLLFWRFWTHLLFWWPIGIVVMTTLIVATSTVGFFFGYRPSTAKGEDFYVQYPLPRVFGLRLWPISLITLIATAYYLPGITMRTVEWVSSAPKNINLSTFWWITGFLLCSFLTRMVWKFLGTETWKMCKEYVKAKKQKVCPIVTIKY